MIHRMNTHEKTSDANMRLLTADQVAEMLAVSRSTVWRWAGENQLPTVRLGAAQRLVRFRAQDVEALIHRTFPN